MEQYVSDPQDSETAGHTSSVRFTEFVDQHWSRRKSVQLAEYEDFEFNDEHWAVIVFLRKHYLVNGLPRNARVTARALEQEFHTQGGMKYLYRLFPGGPVSQGSRLANLRTPAYATDPSFGSSY
jgi:tRNA 2-thiouridine synthesizing protein E